MGVGQGGRGKCVGFIFIFLNVKVFVLLFFFFWLDSFYSVKHFLFLQKVNVYWCYICHKVLYYLFTKPPGALRGSVSCPRTV